MTDQANPLAQFSDVIAARVEATTAVVAISLAHERHRMRSRVTENCWPTYRAGLVG